MYDKSRITAIMLCFMVMFQIGTYTTYAEETVAYKLTGQKQIDFDGTSIDTQIKTGDTILYSPGNSNRGSYAKLRLPAGTYKLECYGSASSDKVSGGYTSGMYTLTRKNDVYLYCGGNYGYNGGGRDAGGATHIATVPGLLSSLSKNYNSTLVMVAGGAGEGGNGLGGGDSGKNGTGKATSSGWGLAVCSGSYSESTGGTQKSGGKGGKAQAGGASSTGGSGSFGKGGTGDYDGGGGFYGGGAGAGKVSDGYWINDQTGMHYAEADAYVYGAGGSGYVNKSFLTETSSRAGKNAGAGKIMITCIEAIEDLTDNILRAPKQVISGSQFNIQSENSFNNKITSIDRVNYQMIINGEIEFDRDAVLDDAISSESLITEKYSRRVKLPKTNFKTATIKMTVYYSDGSQIVMTQDIEIQELKSDYFDSIRYVGRGFMPGQNSKWTTNQELYNELESSVNKDIPEDIRTLI